MFRMVFGSAVIAATLAAPILAQQTTEKPAAAQNKPAEETRVPQGQPINVKLDLTITDQMGPGEPARKTVTIIAADRTAGSIRSTANASGAGPRAIINVDATPQVLQNGLVKVMLGMEYNPRQGPPLVEKVKMGDTLQTLELARGDSGSSLNQRVTVVLEPGKPLVFSQSADPMSDRKISVEVRATILK